MRCYGVMQGGSTEELQSSMDVLPESTGFNVSCFLADMLRSLLAVWACMPACSPAATAHHSVHQRLGKGTARLSMRHLVFLQRLFCMQEQHLNVFCVVVAG